VIIPVLDTYLTNDGREPLVEDSLDIIATISRPYLQGIIVD
jgi:hypothetical protein